MPSPSPSTTIPIPTQGIRKDLPSLQVGWNGLVEAENWIYRNGVFKVRGGLTDFANDINERPMGFVQYDHGSEVNRIVMGTKTGWWHYNAAGNTWTDLDGAANPLTGGNDNQCVFRPFEKSGTVNLLGCNGKDAPKKWTGAGNYADIAGGHGATAAKCMAVSADRLLMCEGMTVYASDNLDFDAYTDGFTARLGETPGDIVACLEFGAEQVAFYKEDSVYVSFAQADLTDIFRFELVRAGVSGPVSPLSVFPLGATGAHCWLSWAGAVMLFDGSNIYPMEEHITTHIRQTRDYDMRARSFGFYDPRESEIYIFYASQGSTDVDTCVVISWPSQEMHYFRFGSNLITAGGQFHITDSIPIGELPLIGDIDMTLGEMDTGSSHILLGDNGGQVYTNQGYTDDGSAISGWFETGLQFGAKPGQFSVLQLIQHLFPTTTSAQNISIQVGASDYGETRTLQAAQTLDLNAGGPYETQHRLPGQMYSLRMSGDFSVETEWMGSLVPITPGGLK
jgi:hypothetical protein